MRGLNYHDLAARYEVELCSNGCFRKGHGSGFATRRAVHMNAERAVTRSGLRRFLMLVHEAHSDWTWFESWARRPGSEKRAYSIWSASVFASRTALHDLGIRLPAKLAETDKARVRTLLVKAPSELRRSTVGRWAGLR